MRNIIATTAISLLMTGAAFADGQIKPITTYNVEKSAGDIYASEFIGMRLYSSQNEEFDGWNQETRISKGSEEAWDDIGEVEDVILGRDGQVKAVILGLGGFAGIGEKDIAVDMKDIKIVMENDAEDAGDFFLVVRTNAEMLKSAEGLNLDEEVAQVKEALNEAKEETILAREKLMRPDSVSRDGYVEATAETATAERLQGLRVFDANDKDIGEVDQVLTTGGAVDGVIIDVGGFLGIGEKPVEVTLDELKILQDAKGEDVRVYIDATQEQLEAQPTYKGT